MNKVFHQPIGAGISTTSQPPMLKPSSSSSSSSFSNVTPILPCASQQESWLFRIPAEILLMLFEEILVSDTPIATRSTYLESPVVGRRRDAQGRFRKNPTVTGFKLTPALLRTCQAMLREGLPFLYLKNQLVMQYYSARSGEIRSIDSQGYGVDDRIITLGDKLLMSTSRRGDGIYHETIANIAQRFQRITLQLDLDLGHKGVNHLRKMLERTSSIFPNKKVDVHVNLQQSIWQKQKVRLLHSLLFLRCTELRMTGVSHPIVAQIAEVATSMTPIINLESCQVNLAEMLNSLLRGAISIETQIKVQKRQTDLALFVKSQHLEAFLELRLWVLQQWNRLTAFAKAQQRAVSSGRNSNRSSCSDTSQRRQPRYDVAVKTLLAYHLKKSTLLTLELDEDGKIVNESLERIAVVINMSNAMHMNEI